MIERGHQIWNVNDAGKLRGRRWKRESSEGDAAWHSNSALLCNTEPKVTVRNSAFTYSTYFIQGNTLKNVSLTALGWCRSASVSIVSLRLKEKCSRKQERLRLESREQKNPHSAQERKSLKMNKNTSKRVIIIITNPPSDELWLNLPRTNSPYR